jgi:hypothetical protein
MTEDRIYEALKSRNRQLARLWRAGQLGHYGGLVGALFSVAYWTGAFIVEVARSGPEHLLTGPGGLAVTVVSLFAGLMVCSVVLKYYALKRAGVDLGLLGQEAD